LIIALRHVQSIHPHTIHIFLVWWEIWWLFSLKVWVQLVMKEDLKIYKMENQEHLQKPWHRRRSLTRASNSKTLPAKWLCAWHRGDTSKTLYDNELRVCLWFHCCQCMSFLVLFYSAFYDICLPNDTVCEVWQPCTHDTHRESKYLQKYRAGGWQDKPVFDKSMCKCHKISVYYELIS